MGKIKYFIRTNKLFSKENTFDYIDCLSRLKENVTNVKIIHYDTAVNMPPYAWHLSFG